MLLLAVAFFVEYLSKWLDGLLSDSIFKVCNGCFHSFHGPELTLIFLSFFARFYNILLGGIRRGVLRDATFSLKH